VLFSSFEFLFLFLPACLAAALLARHLGTHAAVFVTLLFSLCFYGYFRPDYLLLIGASIVVNYLGGERLRAGTNRPLLIALVAFNLLLLGVFKYADFVLRSLDLVVPAELPRLGIMLPLAISFFTFQQIAYVVDCHRRATVQNNFAEYALFVSFFPQLIAGPIVRQQEIMRDLRAGCFYPDLARIGHGLSIFAFGLFKKVFFADQFAGIADPIFDRNEAGAALSQIDAWTGLLAYTLQIYFDFSG
jgi:D-alanyl-lipoteichoic acid acyltransferase DltB (MBOAT superfamily)